MTNLSTEIIIKGLYPPIQGLARRLLSQMLALTGRAMNVVQGYRGYQEQENIYSIGRKQDPETGTWVIENPGLVVTNALPGKSLHNLGLAFDCAFAGADPYLKKELPEVRNLFWRTYSEIGLELGFKPGRDIKLLKIIDWPHMQMDFGLPLSNLLAWFDASENDPQKFYALLDNEKLSGRIQLASSKKINHYKEGGETT